MAIKNELNEFCNFGSELIMLPFHFIGKPPSGCFKMVEKPAGSCTTPVHFEYYGREVFHEIYNNINALDYQTSHAI